MKVEEKIQTHPNKHQVLMSACLCVLPQPVTLYGSSMLGGSVPAGQPLEIEGASQPGVVAKNGLVLFGADGKAVSVSARCCTTKQTFRANKSEAG